MAFIEKTTFEERWPPINNFDGRPPQIKDNL